jgi:hypothetical protein
MKKIVFILSAIVLASCSKSKTDETVVTPTEVVKDKVELKTAFFYASNGHDLSNIQVGDTLTYKFEISTNIKSENFIISPAILDKFKHQIINTDYTLFYNKLKCNEIKALSNKTGEFKILVNKAGNFQHVYIATTPSATEKTLLIGSEPNDVKFNAVRIIVYRYNYNYYTTNAGHHWDRYFNKLYIDNGDQKDKDDNYLKGLDYEVKFLSYTTGGTNFPINTNVDFAAPYEKWGGDVIHDTFEVNPGQIDKLTFTKVINGTPTKIVYNNIPNPYWGQRPEWGDGGNNNL